MVTDCATITSSRFMKTLTSRSVFWLTAFVFVLAAAVRLLGIQHDLPHSFYPDEAHLIKRALSFGSGDLNPHWFHKPAFYMYLLFFEYGVLYSVGRVIGSWASVEDFAVSYVVNPGPFVLIGRLTTFAFSMGTILYVWRIGEKFLGKHVGLFAALLLALTYGHVAASRDVKADVPAAFFCVASAFYLLSYATDKHLRHLALASMLAGVGAATKFYPVVMLAPICLTILAVTGRDSSPVRWLTQIVTPGLMAIGLFFASFFVLTPYSILDPLGRQETLSRVGIFTQNVAHSSSDQAEPSPGEFIQRPSGFLTGAAQYLQVAVSRTGMGLVIGPICLIGLFMVGFNIKSLALCVFPVLFALTSVAAYPGYAEPRHQVAIYPFLCITGAVLVVAIMGKVKWHPAAIASFCLILLAPAWSVANHATELSKYDTRNVAKVWIEENISRDARLLMSENGPPLLTSRRTLEKRLQRADDADRDGQFTAHYHTYVRYQLLAADRNPSYEIHEIRLPWWREQFDEEGEHVLDSDYDRDMGNPLLTVGVNSYDHYVDDGFDYAIVHSNHYALLMYSKRLKDRYPAYREFYKELEDKGELIREFAPGSMTRGPTVRIYRLNNQKT